LRRVDAINTLGVSAGWFALFRVVSCTQIPRFPVHAVLYAWFDSRQLHKEKAGQGYKLWPAFFCVKMCWLSSYWARRSFRYWKWSGGRAAIPPMQIWDWTSMR